MRLAVTRRSDLAAKGILELARSGDRLKASELAARIGTTPGFLSQVMTPLVNKGWVQSEFGPSGGYVAVVDLADLSVLDLIEALEGPTQSDRCVLEDRTCGSDDPCAIHESWRAARAQLMADLDAIPMSSLVKVGAL